MMTDLDAFRSDTRAWLEANCPAEMRSPLRSEADACWGGRNWTFQSDAQRQWLEAMAGRGWTGRRKLPEPARSIPTIFIVIVGLDFEQPSRTQQTARKFF